MRQVVLAGMMAVGITLGGCSGYDVELRGGVFDALGVSNLNAKREEPEMNNRPGLVIPPTTASLPAPGSVPQAGVAANGEAFPVNPEDRKKTDTAQMIAQHQQFCENARLRYENGLAPVIEKSPWGSCHESVLRNMTGRDLSGQKAVGKD
jgi:hypothetical protein